MIRVYFAKFQGIFISLLFALLMVTAPWEEIRGNEYTDVINYEVRIDTIRRYGTEYYGVSEKGLFDLVRAEYLWTLLLSLSRDIGSLLFLKILSGIAVFLSHQFLSKAINPWLAAVVLLNPISIDLFNSQVRSAFSFSIFLYSTQIFQGRSVYIAKFFLAAALLMIHTAMFYVFAVYAASVMMARITQYSPLIRGLLFGAGAIFVGAVIAQSAPVVLELTGDRRSGVELVVKTPTYLCFWIFLGLFLILGSNKVASTSWRYYFSIGMCLSGALMDVFGFPGFRFVALSLPVVFSAVACLAANNQIVVFGVMPLYYLLLYGYWLQ